MKAFLMYRDRDFDIDQRPPINEPELTDDLGLTTLFDAMSRGDELLWQGARTALLGGVATPEEIRYRQAVVNDCLQNAALVRELYDLAVDAIGSEKRIYRTFFKDRPEALLRRSVQVLDMFVGMLSRLRDLADRHATRFDSDGFTRFFATIQRELDDEYLLVIAHHLRQLRFREGLLMSARLGDGNRGMDHVLREPRDENRGFFGRVSVKKPSFSMTIHERDEAGFRSLSQIRDRGLNLVANAAAQSADHVLSFFVALRGELSFYVGCVNLHELLAGRGEPICFPVPRDVAAGALSARALYDPCLSMQLDGRATGNDLDADGTSLILITGANQGGKSTFLRSLGVAYLMMQCGLFVAAEEFSASVSPGLFTHYAREEDAAMASGKLDEELSRMRDIADQISPGCVLLCNESLAATNEREGSEIAREIIRAMVDCGVRVYFVTHLFDLGDSLYQQHRDDALFLRAPREADGRRTFRLVEGRPLPTSYGADVFNRIFGANATPAARAV